MEDPTIREGKPPSPLFQKRTQWWRGSQPSLPHRKDSDSMRRRVWTLFVVSSHGKERKTRRVKALLTVSKWRQEHDEEGLSPPLCVVAWKGKEVARRAYTLSRWAPSLSLVVGGCVVELKGWQCILRAIGLLGCSQYTNEWKDSAGAPLRWVWRPSVPQNERTLCVPHFEQPGGRGRRENTPSLKTRDWGFVVGVFKHWTWGRGGDVCVHRKPLYEGRAWDAYD